MTNIPWPLLEAHGTLGAFGEAEEDLPLELVFHLRQLLERTMTTLEEGIEGPDRGRAMTIEP